MNATNAVERVLGSADAVVRTRLWGPSLMETAAARGVEFAGTPDGGCMWPDFLPAYDAAVTLVKLLDLLAPSTGRCPGVAGLPTTHVAHETIVDAVGAQGHGDARDRRAGREPRPSSSTASRSSSPIGGRWCCPTPTRR